MFWKYNYAVSPQIEHLLEKEDITLFELMDEEDILQECKAQNKKLVEFLLRPNILEQLVTLITTEPSSDADESTRYRHSNTACEILTCDLPALNERLSGDSALLQTLYAFIEQEPPLNPLLCSFFSKTLSMLITRRSEQNWYSYQFSCLQVVEFLKTRPECVSTLIRHMATPAIMDLLFKLLSQVEGNEMRSSVINWLDSQKIVPSLVGLLKPEHGPDIHCNVAQLLCDVVRADREARLEHADVDCVLTALESPETVTLVLGHILTEPRMESSIVGGIQFLLVLLDQTVRTNPPYLNDNGTKDDLLHNAQQQEIVAALLPYLRDFHDVLVNPPQKHSIKTTVGVLEVPVGNARLQIARFICTLIGYGDCPGCCEKLADLGIIDTLLDLFFQYPWNNFLHGYVEKCISSILQQVSSEASCLQKRLFDEGRIIQRMLEGYNNNVCQQAPEKGVRKGYMGHIIKILNNIESISSEPLKEFISSLLSKDSITEEAWSTFISGPLKEVNKIQSALLGGVHPAHCKPDEINEDFKEIPFPATSIHTSQLGDMPPEFSSGFGNFDEDNLDTDMESNLDAFMNILSMGTNFRSSNDDWQMSGDGPNDIVSKTIDDPWCNEIATLTSANPWTSVPEDTQEQGWADFSSDNFADFDTNFCKQNPDASISENKNEDNALNKEDNSDKTNTNDAGTKENVNYAESNKRANDVQSNENTNDAGSNENANDAGSPNENANDAESKDNANDAESKDNANDAESKENANDAESKENANDAESKENANDSESNKNEYDAELAKKIHDANDPESNKNANDPESNENANDPDICVDQSTNEEKADQESDLCENKSCDDSELSTVNNMEKSVEAVTQAEKILKSNSEHQEIESPKTEHQDIEVESIKSSITIEHSTKNFAESIEGNSMITPSAEDVEIK